MIKKVIGYILITAFVGLGIFGYVWPVYKYGWIGLAAEVGLVCFCYCLLQLTAWCFNEED